MWGQVVDWVGEEGEHSFTLCNLVDFPRSSRMDADVYALPGLVDELVRFDSITTMVDGLNIEKSLDRYDVAREQIKAAALSIRWRRFEFSEFNNPKMPDRFLILIGQDLREGTELIDWSRFFCTPQHLVENYPHSK